MTNGETGAGLLSPYRVLDLAYDNGILAGKILADLGADVIAIEPPEGSPVRRLPPFYRDKPGTEHSLVWWAYAAGKRSAVLDLKSEPGRERLLSLAKTADFLLESFPPGYLDELGLGFNALHDLSPRLVVVSMTPFGQDGPYSRYEAPDIVGAALGGFMNLTGDSDRPPLRVSEQQFPSHLGAAGAAGAMIAHHHRLLTGRGQHVDVSGQQAIARALAHAPAFWSLLSTNIQRYGTRRERAGGLKSRTLWPCKDGYVTYALQGGPMGASTNALARWVDEEGFGDDFLRSMDWTEVDFNDDVQDTVDRVAGQLEQFFAAHTKTELYYGSVERRVVLFPVSTPSDVYTNPQLAARGYFTKIEHPDLGASFDYPGGFVRSTEAALGPRFRAPRLGEHTAEVLGSLPTATFSSGNSAARPPTTGGRGAFDGIKVLDFCWVAIGPMTTRYMADHGATVIRVESSRRIEALRRGGPFKDDEPGVNRSGHYANYNSNKLGVTLNMTHPKAPGLTKRLIEWADVVTENFTPGTLERWGLGYDEMRVINPDVILFSASMLGRGGPHDRQPGFGAQLGSLAGFVNMTGWPDRTPVPPYGAYTDFFIPRFAISAIVAALDHRRRTGRGQHLDLSQLEVAQHFLATAMLDYTVNGRERERLGNRSEIAAPHGAYPCKGDDRWCVIAVETDDQWRALCHVMSEPAWCTDDRFATLDGRKRHEAEIDERLSAWTKGHEARELMNRLQAAGVPAGEVNRCSDLFTDPQLLHRDHFVWMDHEELGRHAFDGTEFKLSETPPRYERPSPLLGEHNDLVFRDILGISDAELSDLAAAGLFE